MALIAYWIAHPTTGWLVTPTGAQIKDGFLSDGTTSAAFSGFESGFATTGTIQIDETTAITTASAGVEYTQAWTVYDDVATTYSTPTVGALRTAYLLSAASGTFSYSGGDAGLAFNRVLVASGGTFSHTGGDATFTYTPISGDDYTLACASGTFSYTGGAAGLAFNRALIAASGTFSYAGGDARLARGLVLSAAGGTFSYSGGDATFVFQQAPAGFPVVLSLPTFVPGSITNTGARGRVTATAA